MLRLFSVLVLLTLIAAALVSCAPKDTYNMGTVVMPGIKVKNLKSTDLGYVLCPVKQIKKSKRFFGVDLSILITPLPLPNEPMHYTHQILTPNTANNLLASLQKKELGYYPVGEGIHQCTFALDSEKPGFLCDGLTNAVMYGDEKPKTISQQIEMRTYEEKSVIEIKESKILTKKYLVTGPCEAGLLPQ